MAECFVNANFTLQAFEYLAEGEVTISTDETIKSRPLKSNNRDHDYPQKGTPFYTYGSPEQMRINIVVYIHKSNERFSL